MPRPRKRSERPEAKRLQDRLEMARRLREGKTHEDIAVLLGVSRQTVTKETALLRQEWKAAIASEVNNLIEESAARLTWVQRQSAAAWLQAAEAAQGSTRDRATVVLALAGVSLEDLPGEAQAAILEAVGPVADLPWEALRVFDRAEGKRMRLLGIEGQYVPEAGAGERAKPEDVKTAEDGARLYERAVGQFKPFRVMKGGRS